MKKEVCIRLASVVLLMTCGLADGAVMTQYSPVVQSATIALDIGITNNDPSAIYNSATLNLDALCGDVADIVIARNAAYTGFTRNAVLQEWGISILQPSAGGEVSTGWNRTLDANGVLQLTKQGGKTDDTWYSTIDNPSQDLMALTVSIPKSQLDFNGNGLFDAASEAVYLSALPVSDAFTGEHDSLNHYSATGTSYGVIPEPATAGLLAVGVVLALALKKLRTFYAR